ncbi:MULTISPECIES: hypothetical protein [unclassified Arcicella]|uniref:hypothetical protein n=1 Tax=unclassified Arcicella TaxID=2644986 RepID=UPI002863255E|nr:MULTISPECIES: hypothetical protein [unclassified Arcicella]MDR6564514.1 hypothetical protein [Arcicella sp. BE51]MDR6814373.1 hypothetical protein [Arcicella sp. BE140]MDR6825605.1 hypothetical protein [Arcicella sp. BE139]
MENLPPLPEIVFISEQFEHSEIKPFNKKDIKKLLNQIKKTDKLLFDEKNYCPIKSKLSTVELILHKILNELSRIAKNEGIDPSLHDVKFHNLASCKYSIEDAQSAIDEYKRSNYERHSYLAYFGLLQAFQNQQDSLKNFYQLIFNKKIRDALEIFPEFKQIRTIRNKVLHSTENTKKEGELLIVKNYVIIQSSMKKNGFDLIEKTKETNTRTGDNLLQESNLEKIDLYYLIELQEEKVLFELNNYFRILRKCKTFKQVENICPK